MAIFGTIGLLRVSLPVSSGFLACFRGISGMLVLLLPLLTKKEKQPIRSATYKKALPLLLFSGALIGVNWILLFEAYRFTTVAKATLSYYMAPVFIVLASPIVLREKLRLKQMICVLAAVAGMIPVSGVLNGEKGSSDLSGVLLGLAAAALYAGVVLLNKRLSSFPPLQKTAIQLGAAGFAVLPYALLSGGFPTEKLTAANWALLLVAGVVHTGAAYLLYFAAIPHLSAQTAAVFSYIDPAVAILLSVFLLKEPLNVWGWIGAALILGATLLSGLEPTRKKGDISPKSKKNSLQ